MSKYYANKQDSFTKLSLVISNVSQCTKLESFINNSISNNRVESKKLRVTNKGIVIAPTKILCKVNLNKLPTAITSAHVGIEEYESYLADLQAEEYRKGKLELDVYEKSLARTIPREIDTFDKGAICSQVDLFQAYGVV